MQDRAIGPASAFSKAEVKRYRETSYSSMG
jgi:hypothetical protein